MSNETSAGSKSLKSPVLFLVFNRPDTTKRVFEAIRQAQPSQLFVAADGPRENNPGEVERCKEARGIVQDGIDWDCEVKTLLRDKNMGCKVAVSSAIDWFFGQVKEGIILEDDCLPHPTFFGFCEELLDKYRDDERIGQISGDNFQFGRNRRKYSYYFSRYAHVWGWATWRRVWKNYDVDMKLWPEIRDDGWLQGWLGNKNLAEYWTRIFEDVYQGKIDTWDYQWGFTCWSQNCLTVLPSVNLISNIGFSKDATHTTYENDKSAGIPAEAMKFPLVHMPFVIRDGCSDENEERYLMGIGLAEKVKSKIYRAIRCGKRLFRKAKRR
jgi:hypothetical protein